MAAAPQLHLATAGMEKAAKAKASPGTATYQAAMKTGKAALGKEQWEEAQAAFTSALEAKPRDEQAAIGLRRAQNGIYGSALALARKELGTEQPDKDGVYRRLSEAKRQRIDDAVSAALAIKRDDQVATGIRKNLGPPSPNGNNCAWNSKKPGCR
ncbi:MAG: hypothetical protein NTW87_21595 [Planctomycetota bacterium]|nr:hypothetical protein [Planctomycetota bacterium]